MSNHHGGGHIFTRFDDEMRHLHGLVIRLGELAISQLSDALATLENEDPKTAYRVIENDAHINQLDIQANDEIIRVIAKRQPMARDLRELIAVGKIVAELERAGDEARKIAKLTIRFYEIGEKPPAGEILQDIFSLSEYVADMLAMSMHAFEGPDLQMAGKVLKKGIELDQQLQAVLRRISTFIPEDSGSAGHFVDIVLGIRALERFGGHAKNIAGHIVFLEQGKDVRHEQDESILGSIGEDRNS